jgi:hypothetical protein
MSNILTANSVKYSILVFWSFILGNLLTQNECQKRNNIICIFNVLVTEGTMTLVTLPLGLFAGFS